jgi:Uncharacterized protein conserved in bacteria
MILLGIDVLQRTEFADLKNKAVGLVTNYSFVDSNLNWGIDLLFENGLNVKKIFTPEHGLGGAADGAHVSDYLHPKYGRSRSESVWRQAQTFAGRSRGSRCAGIRHTRM